MKRPGGPRDEGGEAPCFAHLLWTGYQEVMATGHTSYGDRRLEVPALHRDGRDLSIAFTVTLLHRPREARPCAIAAVLRDDTQRWQERRRIKQELTELKADRGTGGGQTAERPS